MVRFLGRDVVKHGHVKEYMAACRALNEAAPNVGMPPIRVYESKWGTWNEVFWEQEFEDSADIERRFAAAHAANDPEWEMAANELGNHVVDGQTYSYVLSEADPG